MLFFFFFILYIIFCTVVPFSFLFICFVFRPGLIIKHVNKQWKTFVFFRFVVFICFLCKEMKANKL
ncbi:hypothetical protein DW096_10180 [Bacteroides sp. AM07-18]|uniref:Uncharacterized protein n=2 Tax=Bacteroides uniformis TaxID=820 RepID=A0A374MR54_BACUN|nr:hypothetical protein DW096_10180 [Bacteroides sp. AM07-18]RGI73942.1 hypothetical protein DXD90_13975 [Bacteroides uniformis]RJU15516.1 hypothetical protein DW039_06825 [Bacteroides sp. AF39-16AC]RJU29320.1 hypothetical protein DW995_04415 [Bacteroides sp. AM51-7]RJU34468.1 hypothetical protein DW947_12620 [Bacteroides sp. AM44-19]RJU76522.1 hypothetical protein DW699_10175 [Bacteroides sp. AM26-2]